MSVRDIILAAGSSGVSGSDVYSSGTQLNVFGNFGYTLMNGSPPDSNGVIGSVPSNNFTHLVGIAFGGESYAVALKDDKTLWGIGYNYGQFSFYNGTVGTIAKTFVRVGNAADAGDVVAFGTTDATIAYIKTNGTLWAIGRNNYGAVGDNTVVDKSSPVQIGAGTNWSKLSSGRGGNFLAIKTDGTLWAWGRNDLGQLGINNIDNKSSPVQVGSGTNWAYVACGSYTSFAIKTDGTLWAWGYNLFGSLGQNNTTDRLSPVQVGTGTNWARVYTNGYSVAAVKTDGTLWAWGQNTLGQLGINNNIDKSSPTQVGSDTNWAYVYGNNAGSVFLFTRTDGTLWATGAQIYMQAFLNFAGSKSSPTQVGSGTNWTSANGGLTYLPITVAKTGTSYAFGVLDGSGKIYSAFDSSLSVSSTLYNGLAGGGGLTILNSGASKNVTKFSIGYTCAAFIKTDGTLWTVGSNTAGQLGQNNTTYRSSPVQVGAGTNWADVSVCQSVSDSQATMVAIKTDGTMWSWGLNAQGQLGQNTSDTVNVSSPVQIGALTTWSKVYAAGDSVFAIKTDGTLWSWGYNINGQLGQNISFALNRSSPVQIGAGTNWTYVVGLYRSILALKSDNTLWAWGVNADGQLGDGTRITRSSPVQITGSWSKVAAGSQTSYGIKTDGSLWSWGNSGNGAMGNNAVINRSSPVQIGALTTWTEVGATGGGGAAGAAIKSDGTLWTWGNGGATPYGNLNNTSSPVQVGVNSTSGGTTGFTGFGHNAAYASLLPPVYKS